MPPAVGAAAVGGGMGLLGDLISGNQASHAAQQAAQGETQIAQTYANLVNSIDPSLVPYLISFMQGSQDPAIIGQGVNLERNANANVINSERNALGSGIPNVAAWSQDAQNQMFGNDTNTSTQIAGNLVGSHLQAANTLAGIQGQGLQGLGQAFAGYQQAGTNAAAQSAASNPFAFLGQFAASPMGQNLLQYFMGGGGNSNNTAQQFVTSAQQGGGGFNPAQQSMPGGAPPGGSGTGGLPSWLGMPTF